MQLIRTLTHYRADTPLALAIGNFDGLHLGHRAVLDQMQALAQAHGLLPAVLTFEPHPRQYFVPGSPPFRIEPPVEKFRQLAHMGVARVFALPFNAAMATCSAEDFLNQMLHMRMRVGAVVTGEDFAFGTARAGNTAMLRAWGAAQGVAVASVPPLAQAGAVYSSTAVRHALSAGDMAQAARLLGRPYAITGHVGHGDKRGRTLGFPTANLWPARCLLVPRYGVYAVRAKLAGVTHHGVANLGVRPTVDDTRRPRLEVHLFDRLPDFYGQRLQVELVQFLRPEQTFESLDALRTQIAYDQAAAQHYFSENTHA